MSGKLRKEWVDIKESLGKDAQKALAKAKADLGPTLDKYEKAAATVEKELGSGEATKKASSAFEEMKSLREAAVEACDQYIKVLADYKTDGQYRFAFGKLRDIKYKLASDIKEKAAEYADVAQKITSFTFKSVLGQDWVDAMESFTWHANKSVESFCTHPVMKLSAADLQPNKELERIQTESEQHRQDFTKALKVLKAAACKELKSRKETIALAKKAYAPLPKAMMPINGGIQGLIREWATTQQSLTPKGDKTWAESKEGKAALSLQQAAERALNKDEEYMNLMEEVVDKL